MFAITRHQGGEVTCKQKGFITHVVKAVLRDLNPYRAWERSPISFCDDDRVVSPLVEQVSEGKGEGCFARAADDKIAHRNDGERQNQRAAP